MPNVITNADSVESIKWSVKKFACRAYVDNSWLNVPYVPFNESKLILSSSPSSLPIITSFVSSRRFRSMEHNSIWQIRLYKSGGKMNIKGPVSVPPIIPITRSNFGSISAINTPKPIIVERTRHRFQLNSAKIWRKKIVTSWFDEIYWNSIVSPFEIFSQSSTCWNNAECPTALERHSCSVTSNMAKYRDLLRGKISRTFAVAVVPNL